MLLCAGEPARRVPAPPRWRRQRAPSGSPAGGRRRTPARGTRRSRTPPTPTPESHPGCTPTRWPAAVDRTSRCCSTPRRRAHGPLRTTPAVRVPRPAPSARSPDSSSARERRSACPADRAGCCRSRTSRRRTTGSRRRGRPRRTGRLGCHRAAVGRELAGDDPLGAVGRSRDPFARSSAAALDSTHRAARAAQRTHGGGLT